MRGPLGFCSELEVSGGQALGFRGLGLRVQSQGLANWAGFFGGGLSFPKGAT